MCLFFDFLPFLFACFLHFHEYFFRQQGISVRTVYRNDLAAQIDWADIVISAGGDGTFLAAAAVVGNNQKPVIGINTDPIGLVLAFFGVEFG